MATSRIVVAALALALTLTACTGDTDPTPSGDTGSPTLTPTPDPTATEEPPPDFDERSLPALFADDIDGGDLERTGELGDFGSYTSHTVTYRSGDLVISGVLNVPAGEGPFPAIVLNHGYIDPAVYVTGQGMSRERDYLAREGFVVLHTDYRAHADSDPTDDLDIEFRLGYTRDAIAGVKALRELPEVNSEQVALGGRSMGGGVTFNALVAEPGLVDAAVVWASVSTRYEDNFVQWTEPSRPDVATQIVDEWGGPDENPQFWDDLSSRTYFDRVESAVLMHHGTNDESCPYPWAEDTRDALEAEGVDITFHAYEGEQHTFSRDWELSMERTVDFLRAEMSVE